MLTVCLTVMYRPQLLLFVLPFTIFFPRFMPYYGLLGAKLKKKKHL